MLQSSSFSSSSPYLSRAWALVWARIRVQSALVLCRRAPVVAQQTRVDSMFRALRDMWARKHQWLQLVLDLFRLHRDYEDLYQWILERTSVAGSHELGQDLDHVAVRF